MSIITTLRLAIAKLLAPQAFQDSDRYRYLLSAIEQDRHWLSEFPEIRATLERIYLGHFDHYRAIDAEPRCPFPREISRFRDLLRAGDKVLRGNYGGAAAIDVPLGTAGEALDAGDLVHRD